MTEPVRTPRPTPARGPRHHQPARVGCAGLDPRVARAVHTARGLRPRRGRGCPDRRGGGRLGLGGEVGAGGGRPGCRPAAVGVVGGGDRPGAADPRRGGHCNWCAVGVVEGACSHPVAAPPGWRTPLTRPGQVHPVAGLHPPGVDDVGVHAAAELVGVPDRRRMRLSPGTSWARPTITHRSVRPVTPSLTASPTSSRPPTQASRRTPRN